MSGQPLEHIERQLARADEIAAAALESPAGEQVGLKGLAPELRAAAASFAAAHELVKSTERALTKEVGEGQSAIEQLKRVYGELVALAIHKAQFDGDAADSYPTDDDFVAAAEHMEVALEAAGEQSWASEALAELGPVADAAAKEYAEQVGARRGLQKAQGNRARAADEARGIFVAFRQAVRGTFGRASKEYRDLRDRQYRAVPPTP